MTEEQLRELFRRPEVLRKWRELNEDRAIMLAELRRIVERLEKLERRERLYPAQVVLS